MFHHFNQIQFIYLLFISSSLSSFTHTSSLPNPNYNPDSNPASDQDNSSLTQKLTFAAPLPNPNPNPNPNPDSDSDSDSNPNPNPNPNPDSDSNPNSDQDNSSLTQKLTLASSSFFQRLLSTYSTSVSAYYSPSSLFSSSSPSSSSSSSSSSNFADNSLPTEIFFFISVEQIPFFFILHPSQFSFYLNLGADFPSNPNDLGLNLNPFSGEYFSQLFKMPPGKITEISIDQLESLSSKGPYKKLSETMKLLFLDGLSEFVKRNLNDLYEGRTVGEFLGGNYMLEKTYFDLVQRKFENKNNENNDENGENGENGENSENGDDGESFWEVFDRKAVPLMFRNEFELEKFKDFFFEKIGTPYPETVYDYSENENENNENNENRENNENNDNENNDNEKDGEKDGEDEGEGKSVLKSGWMIGLYCFLGLILVIIVGSLIYTIGNRKNKNTENLET